MVDRVLGQLSLADAVAASDETVFDRIAAVIDWGALRALLGQRS
jgi:IS5 family transposase